MVWYSHLLKNFPQFIVIHTVKGFGIVSKPAYDPTTPLLSIHPKETKIEKDTYTLMFIAALFTIARTWKQLRYLSTNDWIKKLWYIYTMQYYSAIKRIIFESVLMWQMDLELIIQSELSHKEKYKYQILMHIYGI